MKLPEKLKKFLYMCIFYIKILQLWNITIEQKLVDKQQEMSTKSILQVLDICDEKHLTSSLTKPVVQLMEVLDSIEQVSQVSEPRQMVEHQGWKTGGFTREPNLERIKIKILNTCNRYSNKILNLGF